MGAPLTTSFHLRSPPDSSRSNATNTSHRLSAVTEAGAGMLFGGRASFFSHDVESVLAPGDEKKKEWRTPAVSEAAC